MELRRASLWERKRNKQKRKRIRKDGQKRKEVAWGRRYTQLDVVEIEETESKV